MIYFINFKIIVIFQMGQTQAQLKQNQDYRLVEQLPVGNIVKHNKTQSLHFLKQYSFTAQQAYQNALNAYSLKLANKNEHVLNFMHFTTKSQNSFCSTFHKIILIFQYVDYSLEKQIANRIKDNRPFNEKQMWSVLCSCVLASVHLIHCQGRMHCGLTPKDIRLSPSGCVKLLSHQMIGMDGSHSQNQGHPKMLALALIECMNFQKLNNQDNDYLERIIEGLQCSREMKDMLTMMISKNIKFTEIQQHLFKLVQDDQSLASQSNTPILKSQSPLNSNYKCPKIYRNQDTLKHSKALQQKLSELQPLAYDQQDVKSYLYLIESCQTQFETPDQTQQDTNTEQSKQAEECVQQVEPFFLKQRKIQNNINIQVYNEFEKDKKFNIHKDGEQIKINKNYEINALPSSRRKQNAQVSKTVNVVSNFPSQKQQNLFTDPKLFSLIKNDLQEIKMRRSIGELGKYTRTQQSKIIKVNNEAQHQSVPKNEYQTFSGQTTLIPITSCQSYELPVQTQTIQQTSWFKKQEINNNQYKIEQHSIIHKEIKNQHSVIHNQFKNIEIIREVSQQYKQEDDKSANINRKNSIQTFQNLQKFEDKKNTIQLKINAPKVQPNVIQNIMNDTQMGFRKKKQSTGKFQMPKQNIPNDLKIQKQIQKKDNSDRGVKTEQNIQTKSKTVGMKPGQTHKKSNHMHEQLTQDYDGSQHTSTLSSQRIEKSGRDGEKLIHVNQKYNRGRYEGTKLNGKRHGHGTFYYSEGGKYVGNWRENKMHGKGILYYPTQQVAYEGQWENDQLSGYGTLFNQEVSNLKTPFDYRDWSDVEDYWVKYQGHFYQDNKEGQGKLYLVNGQRLQAEFHDDKVDGQGILFRGDGSSVKGKWRQNKLVRLF